MHKVTSLAVELSQHDGDVAANSNKKSQQSRSINAHVVKPVFDEIRGEIAAATL